MHNALKCEYMSTATDAEPLRTVAVDENGDRRASDRQRQTDVGFKHLSRGGLRAVHVMSLLFVQIFAVDTSCENLEQPAFGPSPEQQDVARTAGVAAKADDTALTQAHHLTHERQLHSSIVRNVTVDRIMGNQLR